MELQKALMFAAIAIAVWTSLHLLIDPQGHRRSNRWFAALLLALCVPQLYFYSRLTSPGGWMPLALISLSLVWVKGPIMLIFVHIVVQQPMRRPWLAFVPFAVAVLLLWIMPQLQWTIVIVGALFAVACLLRASRLLYVGSPQLTTIYRNFKNSAHYWLLLVIIGLASLIVFDALIGAFVAQRGAYPIMWSKWATFAISIYLVAVAFLTLYRPTIFFDRHATPEPMQERPAGIFVGEAEPCMQVRSGRELDTKTAKALEDRLNEAMKTGRLYLRNDLSLPMLAATLGISVHQASELLNVHLATSFYDYVNDLRLKHACALLSDPACKLRIIDIAFESGFNNKNSFHRVFRDRIGTTPVEYRRRQHPSGTSG